MRAKTRTLVLTRPDAHKLTVGSNVKVDDAYWTVKRIGSRLNKGFTVRVVFAKTKERK